MIEYLFNRYHAWMSRKYLAMAREGDSIELRVSLIQASNWHARRVGIQ